MSRKDQSAARESSQTRVDLIRKRMEAACDRSGRDNSEVSLMAVTKQQTAESIAELSAHGIARFGENRVQEIEAKWRPRDEPLSPALRLETSECAVTRQAVSLSLIGHLQRNKAAKVLPFVDSVESLDSLRLAKELVKRLEHENRLEVLIQINTSGEASKSGLAEDEAAIFGLVEFLCSHENIVPRGLMTIAPFVEDRQAIRASFRSLYRWFTKIEDRFGIPAWSTLSMGMSGDFEIAIEEGSTEVRIGTALFGARSTS